MTLDAFQMTFIFHSNYICLIDISRLDWYKNAKDNCGRASWGSSGQVVYTPRHFDRPKT